MQGRGPRPRSKNSSLLLAPDGPFKGLARLSEIRAGGTLWHIWHQMDLRSWPRLLQSHVAAGDRYKARPCQQPEPTASTDSSMIKESRRPEPFARYEHGIPTCEACLGQPARRKASNRDNVEREMNATFGNASQYRGMRQVLVDVKNRPAWSPTQPRHKAG